MSLNTHTSFSRSIALTLTDLVGALITSTQAAEDEGLNRFSTGTLTFSDLKNQANQFMRVERLDGIGPARYGELEQLHGVTIRVHRP